MRKAVRMRHKNLKRWYHHGLTRILVALAASLMVFSEQAGHRLRAESATLDAAGAVASQQAGRRQADFVVPSRPETVTWGWFPIDVRPVLTIRSGQTVRIDTLSHAGATQDEDPVTFLGPYGVRREEILQDVLDFWASRAGRPREGRSVHILTGPISIEGAEGSRGRRGEWHRY